MKKSILSAALLLAGALASSAAVTVQGWWHYGEAPTIQTDSSGNGRHFALGFSCAGSGNPGAAIAPTGVGGPLGTTGFTSANALYWTPLRCAAAAMWNPWGSGAASAEWNPPPTNYVIECWILPEDTGISTTANRTWFFASGSGDFSQPDRPPRTGAGGVYFAVDKASGPSQIGAFVIANAAQGVPAEVQIGAFVDADTNQWMHVAVVNRDGTNAFYVNGVQRGVSTDKNTIPNGNIFGGGSPGTVPSFRGYLDELRISTFAPGAFSTADLLLRPPGPSIIAQPQSATVWNGGAAPFAVVAVIDPALTYQWQREGTNLPGATSASLYLPQVSLADHGAQFQCIVTASSISVTSSVATLTVAPVNASDVSAYRDAVNAESSLVAYFPVDGSTGATVANTESAAHNGTLGGLASYDGRTNRAFGERALRFDADGDVMVPSNTGFEFGSGNGTLEVVIYQARATSEDPTIFSVEYDNGNLIHHTFGVTRDGNILTYTNDTGGLNWPVSPSLIGRKAHLAFVVRNGTEVTPILDGQPLGTRTNAAASTVTGSPAWIGARGNLAVNNRWAGNIDELAIYNTALSTFTLQTHYSKYFFGTNTVGPSIVSQPASKTLLAGSSPTLRAQATGTLPLLYQWTSNGVAIPGATAASLVLPNTTVAASANYTLYVTNAVGWTNTQPIALTFIAAPSPYSTAVAADGPTAYWRLNESSGTTAIDSAGFNDATYFPPVTFGAAPVILNETDPAVDFATGSGRAQVGNVPELNPAGPFTLEAWTRPNAGASGIIVSSQNRNNSRAGYSLHANIFTAQYGIDLGAPNAQVTRFTSTTLPAAGAPVHLVFTFDGVNGVLYVNGQAQSSQPLANFVNNTVAPLTIGKRSDNAAPWNGVVDEVAFYNYALSEARVSNHWSHTWTAANITTEPLGVTTNEWSTISLSTTATGIPNTYQWQKGGVDLSDENNPDGTRHYPNGVTNLNLVISQTHPADSGTYRLVVTNPVGGDTSVNANVVINADTTKPAVALVTALPTPNPIGTNPYAIKITFSEIVDPTSAGTLANYSVSGVTVDGVTVSANNFSAYLATSGLVPGQQYTVNVSAVKDQAQTPNTMDPAIVTASAPVLVQGVSWDYYANITPQGVASLLSSPYFPVAPSTNVLFTSFDSGLLTGGDLNNKPGFPAPLGENYGSSLSGWITPTVTTNYYFYIASDDASELFLSTDANPSNAVSIAVEPSCCSGFREPGTYSSTSAAIALTSGVSYFIRALQTEGGGGDYVRVAWKMENDPTGATNLVPISGSVLKAYAQLPAPRFNAASFNPANGQLTISWTGTGTLYQSPDLVNWSPVAGNPSSPYLVNVSGAPRLFYRVVR